MELAVPAPALLLMLSFAVWAGRTQIADNAVAEAARAVAREASLAVDAETAVGCGGIRRIADTAAGEPRFEVKHLFLRPVVRGRGAGKLLLRELESRAAAFGAEVVVLDTNASLEAAGGLYRSSGYRDVEPFNDNPNATNWYEKRLAG